MANLNRVNELPSSGLTRGDQFLLNVGGGKYQTYIVSDTLELVKEAGADFIEKDTMAQMRALSAREIWALQNGYYKGVKLNGYYEGQKYQKPLEYYVTSSSDTDDEGAIIDLGSIKLQTSFIDGIINVLYYGMKSNTGDDNSIKFSNILNYIAKYPRGTITTDSSYIGWLEPTIKFNLGEYIIKNITIPSGFTRFNIKSTGRTSIKGASGQDTTNNFISGAVSGFTVEGCNFFNYNKCFNLTTGNVDFAFISFKRCNFGRIKTVFDSGSYSTSRSTSLLFQRCRFSYNIERIAITYTDKFCVKDCWIMHNENSTLFYIDSLALFQNNVWVPSRSTALPSDIRAYIEFEGSDPTRSITFISERFGGESGSCPIVIVGDVNKNNIANAYRNQGIKFIGCYITSNTRYSTNSRGVVILKKPTAKINSINYVSFDDCSILPDFSGGAVTSLEGDGTLPTTLIDNFIIEYDYSSYYSATRGLNTPADSVLLPFVKSPQLNTRNATPTVKGLVNQAAASADTATQASGATPTKAEFDALLAELRDVKTKLRTAGTLAPNTP